MGSSPTVTFSNVLLFASNNRISGNSVHAYFTKTPHEVREVGISFSSTPTLLGQLTLHELSAYFTGHQDKVRDQRLQIQHTEVNIPLCKCVFSKPAKGSYPAVALPPEPVHCTGCFCLDCAILCSPLLIL